jgi:hypothetical protein
MHTQPDAPHAVADDRSHRLEVVQGARPVRSASAFKRRRRRFWTWVTRRPMFGVVHSAFIHRRLSRRLVA